MRKDTRFKTENEKEKTFIKLWKKRIVEEKGYPESVAERIVQRINALADYMQYGHAAIAFYKQNGEFQLVTGTLVPYPREFHHPFETQKVHSTFVFWNEDVQGWRSFQIENFLEWKAIV